MDKWWKLWDKATSEPEGAAVIEVTPDDSDYVVLTWPDGSKGAWYWHDGDWQPCDTPNTAPCDVAARDSF